MAIANGPYEGGRRDKRTGSLWPGAQGAVRWLKEVIEPKFPPARVTSTLRNSAGGGGFVSVHYEGRAIDLGQGGQVPTGWSMDLAYALINSSAELGINSVIHNNSQWRVDKKTWSHYTGVNHRNHLHFELSRAMASKSSDEVYALFKKVLSKPNISDPFPETKRTWDVPIKGEHGLLPGSYEGGSGKSESAEGVSPEIKTYSVTGGKDFGPKSEENLTGMEHYKAYKDIINGQADASTRLPQSDLDGLNKWQQSQLVDIKENISARKPTTQGTASQLITMSGLLGMLYSVGMIVAGIFDSNNVFTEGSLLRTITFGRVDLVDSPEDKGRGPNGERRVTLSGLIWLSAIGIFFSLIIISGVVFGWASWFAAWVGSL